MVVITVAAIVAAALALLFVLVPALALQRLLRRIAPEPQLRLIRDRGAPAPIGEVASRPLKLSRATH